ncbi:MAG: hypothetical protein ACOC1I_05870, partial [Spirochaetota bacterium]
MGRRSGRGRSRRRGDQNQKAQQKQPVYDPEKHFMPPPVPKREYEVDPVTGEPISDILTAIADPESGRPLNFDSMVRRL